MVSGRCRLRSLTTASFAEELEQSPLMLIEVWAEGCGPCAAMLSVLEEMAAAYPGRVRYGELRLDDAPDLARQFEVTALPTLLFFRDGELTGRLIGAMGTAQLLVELDKLVSARAISAEHTKGTDVDARRASNWILVRSRAPDARRREAVAWLARRLAWEERLRVLRASRGQPGRRPVTSPKRGRGSETAPRDTWWTRGWDVARDTPLGCGAPRPGDAVRRPRADAAEAKTDGEEADRGP
jgi:thioredoxin